MKRLHGAERGPKDSGLTTQAEAALPTSASHRRADDAQIPPDPPPSVVATFGQPPLILLNFFPE